MLQDQVGAPVVVLHEQPHRSGKCLPLLREQRERRFSHHRSVRRSAMRLSIVWVCSLPTDATCSLSRGLISSPYSASPLEQYRAA